MAWTSPAWLGGCTGSATLDWAGAGLVVLLAALAGLAVGQMLGRSKARLDTEAALRGARAQARRAVSLLEGTRWQTDAQHRPRPAPERGPDEYTSAALLAHPAVMERLQQHQAFFDLRVELPTAQAGSRSWLLRGVPIEDELGGFGGFSGLARQVDEFDAALTGAAALPLLLGLHPGPAVLAVDHGAGWQVQLCNDAALNQWPGLAQGQKLPEALGEVPPEVATAFDHPISVNWNGWHLLPCGALPGSLRALVLSKELAQLAPSSAAPPSGADSQAQAQAQAESDSFSFTVSHDLRAPIRVVEGFTRIVKEDYGRLLDRVGNDHLDRVLGAAARMNLMIDALLTLARLSSQPLARQPVNLSQLASYVVDDLRRSAPEREADFEIQPDLVTEGDPTLLRLVLENLLGNAWKYSARAPRARISLARVPHGKGQAFVVRDNGAGFDMRGADRLFGLFQRLHSASEFPGHGVGLASVRRIVHRHGGDIWAESEPGRGAAFFFTLAG